MDEGYKEAIKFYKKRIEPFIALAVLAFLITGLFLLYQDNQLKEEISQNCGYKGEDYVCYCEYDTVTEYRKFKNGSQSGYVPPKKYTWEELNISKLGENNVSLDG